MPAKEKEVVGSPFSNIFSKIGITGIASAMVTMIFGGFIVIYPFEWDDAKLVIGIFLFIIGLINFVGYIYSFWSEKKAVKTYIEAEVIHGVKEEPRQPPQ